LHESGRVVLHGHFLVAAAESRVQLVDELLAPGFRTLLLAQLVPYTLALFDRVEVGPLLLPLASQSSLLVRGEG
jgi:hypothetical protein